MKRYHFSRALGTPRRWQAFGGAVSFLSAIAVAVQAQAQAPASPRSVPGAPAGVTAFVDANVVPMDTERVLPNQTVLVEGGRITALGPVSEVRVPAGARRINGQGRYLMPGLADMHTHLTQRYDDILSLPATDAMAEARLFLFVANGVTTIRNVDYLEDGGLALRLRARAAAGKLWSPRIYTSAILPLKPGQSIAATVAEYKAAGYDHIKIRLAHELAKADSIAAAARHVGIPVMGHVPSDDVARAFQLGYASIEHLNGYLATGSATTVDPSKIRTLAAATKQAGVWNAPTQLLSELGSQGWNADTVALWSEVRYASPSTRKRWALLQRAGTHGPLEARRRLIKALQDAEAGLLLDTDTPFWYMVPGFSIHRALGALVRSGLTPYQALATGTRNVAVFYGPTYQSGTVAVAKRADLVLLDGNPLVDIQNTTRVAGVMIGGRWLPRQEIDRRLAELVGTI